MPKTGAIMSCSANVGAPYARTTGVGSLFLFKRWAHVWALRVLCI
jgi:hypothetical protein